MSTIDDLNSELKRLRSRVRQLESGHVPQEDNVSLIVSEDATDRSRAGGFAAACDASRRETIQKLLESARQQLKANPRCIDSTTALRSFRNDYAMVPSRELDSLIRELT
jgi:hypothetical protein